MGVEEVRLTGGEPLVRRDLPVLVSLLAPIPGVTDLSLTTNGVLLDRYAGPLVEAGLRRVNVSLDSLSHVRFAEITRRDALDRVLAGLAAAERVPRAEPDQGQLRRHPRVHRGGGAGASPSWRAASRTSSASSSSCRSTPTRPGAATTCSRAARSAR